VLQPPKAPLVDTANLPLEQRLTLAHERARAEAKYYLEFQPDGSFRADDVPPGTYRLILDVRQHDTLAMRPEIMRRYGMAPTVAPEIIRKYGLKPPPHPDIDEESNDDVITGQITNLIVVTEPPRDHPAEPLDLGTLTLQPLP
jgi:hypothetical protein